MSGLSHKSGELDDSDGTSAPEKGRMGSVSEKRWIVEGSFQPGASVTAVAEAHGLHPTQLYRWRKLYSRKLEGRPGAALLPVRLAEESVQLSRPTRKGSKEEAQDESPRGSVQNFV